MSDLTDLEKNKRDYLEHIRLHQAAERLALNPDFQDVILNEFCLKKTAELVGASMNLRISPEDRAVSLELAKGGAALKEFLFVIEAMGEHAIRQLPEIESNMVEARLEESQGA